MHKTDEGPSTMPIVFSIINGSCVYITWILETLRIYLFTERAAFSPRILDGILATFISKFAPNKSIILHATVDTYCPSTRWY